MHHHPWPSKTKSTSLSPDVNPPRITLSIVSLLTTNQMKEQLDKEVQSCQSCLDKVSALWKWITQQTRRKIYMRPLRKSWKISVYSRVMIKSNTTGFRNQTPCAMHNSHIHLWKVKRSQLLIRHRDDMGPSQDITTSIKCRNYHLIE